jgi:uncharacterized membrane protein
MYLQIKTHTKYKKVRAEVGELTNGIWRNDWDKFVKSLGDNLTSPQRRGFKILKKLQLKVNDQTQTNLISKEYWKTHYSKLWFRTDARGEANEEAGQTIVHEEDIKMEELDFVFKKLKIETELT